MLSRNRKSHVIARRGPLGRRPWRCCAAPSRARARALCTRAPRPRGATAVCLGPSGARRRKLSLPCDGSDLVRRSRLELDDGGASPACGAVANTSRSHHPLHWRPATASRSSCASTTGIGSSPVTPHEFVPSGVVNSVGSETEYCHATLPPPLVAPVSRAVVQGKGERKRRRAVQSRERPAMPRIGDGFSLARGTKFRQRSRTLRMRPSVDHRRADASAWAATESIPQRARWGLVPWEKMCKTVETWGVRRSRRIRSKI